MFKVGDWVILKQPNEKVTRKRLSDFYNYIGVFGNITSITLSGYYDISLVNSFIVSRKADCIRHLTDEEYGKLISKKIEQSLSPCIGAWYDITSTEYVGDITIRTDIPIKTKNQ